MKSFTLTPIGVIRTPFKEKFGVPRQALMIEEAMGVLKLNPDPRFKEALRTLQEFTHVWVVFLFHKHWDQEWRPLISPPRLDAPERVGVFASRSPHRPNSIGISALKLHSIDFDARGGIEVHLSGVDLLDGTPVLDLKPYVPYVDSIPEARGGWTETPIPKFKVVFSDESALEIEEAQKRNSGLSGGNLKSMIEQMLTLDPRPTSQRRLMPISDPAQEGKHFAYRVFDLDVHWEIRDGGIFVREIKRL